MIVSNPSEQSIPIQNTSEPISITEKPAESQNQPITNLLLPTLQSQLISNEKKQEMEDNYECKIR